MTFHSIVALFSAMVILAAIPSLSVLTVLTRSASFGLIHGVFTTLGIVVGDVVFILIAIWGLSLLAATLGGIFIAIKYLGGFYLIFLGIGLCWSKPKSNLKAGEVTGSSLVSSFLAGLLITLGDQKATLFYLGFFPAFLDMSEISYVETAVVVATAIVAVGGVKLAYAFMANSAKFLVSPRVKNSLNTAAGCVMIAVGVFVITKA